MNELIEESCFANSRGEFQLVSFSNIYFLPIPCPESWQDLARSPMILQDLGKILSWINLAKILARSCSEQDLQDLAKIFMGLQDLAGSCKIMHDLIQDPTKILTRSYQDLTA